MEMEERLARFTTGGTVFAAAVLGMWVRHGICDGYNEAIQVMLTVGLISFLAFGVLSVFWWRKCMISICGRESMTTFFYCATGGYLCALVAVMMFFNDRWVNFEHPHTLKIFSCGLVLLLAVLNLWTAFKHARRAVYFERYRRANNNTELDQLLKEARNV